MDFNRGQDGGGLGWNRIKPQTYATGYLKQSMISEDINPSLASVTVKKNGNGVVQGGLFWQYYEEIDKVKSSENNLSITKEIYKKQRTETG